MVFDFSIQNTFYSCFSPLFPILDLKPKHQAIQPRVLIFPPRRVKALTMKFAGANMVFHSSLSFKDHCMLSGGRK